jgi:prepilin-type N-terminal cleavage/methylation domain-containing protein
MNAISKHVLIRRGRKQAFTLVEILVAIVLIGIALVTIMTSNVSFSIANNYGTDLTTAEFLVEQIKEMTTMLPVSEPNVLLPSFGVETGETLATYDDLDDFDGLNFSPPIDSQRQALTAYPAFEQQITVQNVSASDYSLVVSDNTTDFVRVTVLVLQNGGEVSRQTWIRARL